MAKLMINYGDHKGRVRARTTVEYIDGSRGRLEAYGGSKREAKINLEEKIEERNKEIRYGKQKRAGDISLADAVKDRIKERREAYDRNKGRERLRDSSAERDDEVFHSLLLPHKISKKKLNQIFVPDVEEYRTWLDRAQYDKCQIKDPARHVPKMTYYSASTLNRIVRLVVAAIDEYYMHSEYKSPAIALKPFQVTTKEKTDEDFLVDDEIYKVLEVFKQMRNSPRYPLDATYADIFTLALLTALRPGELRGLKKRDWNSKTHEIAIMRTGEYEDGRTKTEKSKASIIVIPEAAAILNRRCEMLSDTNDFIFQNTKGMTLSSSDMRKKLRGWLKQAGINKDLHPHSLRGSAGTFMIDAGVDIDTVSELMRHTSSNTTVKYYIARTKKRMRNNADKVAKAYAQLDLGSTAGND